MILLKTLSGDELAEHISQALPCSVVDKSSGEVWVEPNRITEVARFLNEADIQLPGERPPVIKTLTEGTGKFTEKIGEIVNESKKQLEARK